MFRGLVNIWKRRVMKRRLLPQRLALPSKWSIEPTPWSPDCLGEVLTESGWTEVVVLWLDEFLTHSFCVFKRLMKNWLCVFRRCNIWLTMTIAVQGKCRAELARAMLSRSPQSHLTLLSSAKVLHLTCDVNSLEEKSCKNMLIKWRIIVNTS